MPLYNEEATAGLIIEKVLNLDVDLELIIVNNGSTDKTSEILSNFKNHNNIRIIEKDVNIGKGDGIIAGLQYAAGKYTVIQDGDLEYEPNDIAKMVEVA
jgi:glycosyltransferase involved in cell wall biosynthesis